VAEATMNAMEHGNKFKPEVPVDFVVLASPRALAVRITDYGGAQVIPEAHTPDLEAKLAGLQTPRGWGLFLIEKMVDEVRVIAGEGTHTIELLMYREGDKDGNQGA
jgi:anti-sigma regulatory factor (Ser/Thr protein kinase)